MAVANPKSDIGSHQSPRVVVLAGPNGAGKSTTAKRILRGPFRVGEFVNADTIALGLSAFDPQRAALAAGRVMLSRVKELAALRAEFAFETTLASRSFAPWLRELVADGYELHLVFLWLPSPDLAVARVADRVHRGGHSVAESTIRRRYVAGLRNFFELYQPLATTWQMVDNSGKGTIKVAVGRGPCVTAVHDANLWRAVQDSAQV